MILGQTAMPRLLEKKLSESEIDTLVSAKLRFICSVAKPKACYLFGSAWRKTMTISSDIDLLLVYNAADEMKFAKTNLAKLRPRDDWPHDIIFVLHSEFEEKRKKQGSICHEASTYGKNLLGDI